MPYSSLYAYRALERGGKQSLSDFRHAMGLPARVAMTASHIARPLLDNPGRVMSIAALPPPSLLAGYMRALNCVSGDWGHSEILIAHMNATKCVIPKQVRITGR